MRPGPNVIKLFSCSTQLSMKFFLLINVKMPTFVGILTCMSGKNKILGLTEPEQEGHEALNRSPEYTGQKSNI